MCTDNGQGDSEVDDTSKAASDAPIIDVTNDFVSSQGIVDISAEDTECSASPEPVAVIPDVTCTRQADTDVRLLTEDIASVHVEEDLEASSSQDAEVAIVLGGMDTGGEIFDDCLVFRLTT